MLECNIDAKGKAARLVAGLGTLFLGLMMIGNNVTGLSGYDIPGAFIILVIGSAMFTVFEAWQGWCVIRAMGFKTRI